MKQKQHISIRKISELSGVSVATVSRVINNSGPVSAQNREKVEQVIQENHYVPDMVGKRLRTNIVSLIGVIVPDILVEPYAEFIRFVQKTLRGMGIMTSVCITDNDSRAAQEYINILRSQRANGIIYIQEEEGEDITVKDIPIVYAFTPPERPLAENSFAVLPDYRQASYLAARALLEAGCRNIICFLGEREYRSGSHRGYQEALEEAGLSVNPDSILLTNPLFSSRAKACTERLLSENVPFDGVFAASARITIGVLGALHAARKRFPEDVNVIGSGNLRIHDYGLLPISLIHIPVHDMAEKAVSLLLAALQGEACEQREFIFPPRLIPCHT